MGSLALEARGDRRGPHEFVSIAHCLAGQGRIIAHLRFHHSPCAPAFASFCQGRRSWPTKSIWVDATRLSQAVRKALDRDRRTFPRLRGGGCDLGSRRRSGEKDRRLNCRSAAAFCPVAVDVTSYPDVEHARDDTIKALGRIDILVNNAGIAGPNVKTWDYPLDAWRDVLSINLNGPFHCCRALVPAMIAQNYGRIVNIASIAGKEGNPNAPAYSASKAGVIALTKSLGKELASHDISVNCITPAAAKTAIFDQMTQEHINFMLSKIPRGRFVTVDEIASLVAFCASSECSFTTGAVFDISGGRATY